MVDESPVVCTDSCGHVHGWIHYWVQPDLIHYLSTAITLQRLGDRHSENILLDVNTGDVVHVDFDCLFDRVCSLASSKQLRG